VGVDSNNELRVKYAVNMSKNAGRIVRFLVFITGLCLSLSKACNTTVSLKIVYWYQCKRKVRI
jgi:hypothetical protein